MSCKKGGGSESTLIIGPSKSVLVYAFQSLENVLRLDVGRCVKIMLYIILYNPDAAGVGTNEYRCEIHI